MPQDVKFVVDAALRGKSARGWYSRSHNTLIRLYGADAPIVAGIIAATSPRVSVKRNWEVSTAFYRKWVNAGKLLDGIAVVSCLKEVCVPLPAWIPNVLRAVNGKPLSGLKVESFRRNLSGDYDAVVLDTWMAQFFGVPHATLAKPEVYNHISAIIRDAAKALDWYPCEVQETVWSAVRFEIRQNGQGHMFADTIIADTVSFDNLAG